MAKSALAAKPKVEKIGTGLQSVDTKAVATKMNEMLADSFILYLKTQGVHWNVVGPEFYSIHKLTETQYEDLLEAIDMIAERIRSLGHFAHASFEEYAKLSKLKSTSVLNSAQNMLKLLIEDNQAISKRLRGAYKIADDADDVVTADLITHRISKHEQNIWMLQAITI